VRDNFKVLFLRNVWCRGTSVDSPISRFDLFTIACGEDAVADNMQFQSGNIH
jgi:hypothetical protein